MKLCLQCKEPLQQSTWQCFHCNWQPIDNDNFLLFAPELLTEASHFFHKEDYPRIYQAEDKSFWFRARNQLILWALLKFFPEANQFLEIGCGTGYVISNIQKHIPNLTLYAADVFEEALPFVRGRLGEQAFICQMDGRKIPFEEEFDLIGAFDVLEHIEEDELVLQEMHKALKPGGGVLITVPQHPKLWSTTDSSACHVRRYLANELQKKLIKNQFEIIFSSSFVTFLLPLMLASRLKQRKQILTTREIETNKFVNTLLEKMMSFERLCIKLGARFPIGGSRFVVARKAERVCG